MKRNNKMTGPQTATAALLLGALLCAQTTQACWSSLPTQCTEFFNTGTCTGENITYEDEFATNQSFKDVCLDAGNHTFNTYKTCTNTGQIDCTYTLHIDYCDGSSSDTPASGTAPEAKFGDPC